MTGAELLDRRCSKNSGGGIAPTASRAPYRGRPVERQRPRSPPPRLEPRQKQLL